MCNQAVCLVAAELERRGICTVAIQLLRRVVEAVRLPGALLVPFPHGYPLDAPDSPERQLAVIEAALRLLEVPGLDPPVLEEAHGAGFGDAEEHRREKPSQYL